MKRTDLEKNKGLKIRSQMAAVTPPGRYGKDSGAPLDRREQRRLDQAAGLVPFAVKLNADLVTRLQALAQERQVGLNELVAELLQKGLQA